MLNEIIKTAEELNTAALHYRQSGNMDGVRELAKAHAVSKKQTEEFIQAACRMDRPIVAAAAMMVTMTMMSILRPLLRVTLFHAFLTTNMAVSLCVSIDMSD